MGTGVLTSSGVGVGRTLQRRSRRRQVRAPRRRYESGGGGGGGRRLAVAVHLVLAIRFKSNCENIIRRLQRRTEIVPILKKSSPSTSSSHSSSMTSMESDW